VVVEVEAVEDVGREGEVEEVGDTAFVARALPRIPESAGCTWGGLETP
jgi:hypothetical protein